MSDFIRRADAIQVARDTDYIGLYVGDVKKVTDEVVKRLKTIPTVEPTIDEITERIYLTDWYHINSYGDLVQGASGREDALFKAEDIFNILKDMGASEESDDQEWIDWREEQEIEERWDTMERSE